MLTLIKHTAAKATFTLIATFLLIGCGSSTQSPLGPQAQKPAVENPQSNEVTNQADLDEIYQNNVARGQELFEEDSGYHNDPSPSDPQEKAVVRTQPVDLIDIQKDELEPDEDREEF